MSLPRETLLKVPNYHRMMDGGKWAPPAFDPDEAFVAYMPNEYGEQLVYVHEPGETPVLYHGDYAWHPVEVDERGYADLLNMHEAEVLFVIACRKASAPLYDKPRKATV